MTKKTKHKNVEFTTNHSNIHISLSDKLNELKIENKKLENQNVTLKKKLEELKINKKL